MRANFSNEFWKLEVKYPKVGIMEYRQKDVNSRFFAKFSE